ncbi:MAG: YbjN domain-containing protein [Leptolinea sp.]|jgi:hypothetical protein|nr:YbjN domain-containing protein [Leptolinea sp.]
MNELFPIIEKFFTDDEWYFIQLGNQPILQMTFQGKNGKWTCYAQIHEEQPIFFFFSICPVNVPEDKRQKMAEFLTRANYGLKVGNFEMDFSDGEIRYKTSLNVENDQLSGPIIRNLVYANLWTMDRYLAGILSVIYGNIDPAEAIKKSEA